MPSYITKIVNVVGSGGGGACCSNTFSKDSSKFFSSLATKLLEMTTAINNRIDDIKKNCKNSSSGKGGVLLASIDAPQMTLGVKYEYIEYIKRFGPPTDGVFDEKKLQDLRTELGITTGL
jgi:hypothetical protein